MKTLRPSVAPCAHAKARARCTPRAAVDDRAPGHPSAFESYMLKSGLPDFYAVLQVDDDADLEEVKAAYRKQAKVCHPDFTGEAGHNMCILLNEAYETLSNMQLRGAYNAQLEIALRDERDGYTGQPLSKWIPDVQPSMAKHEDPEESRAVFVDEQACIGCKNCVWVAPATFRVEASYGRSRVFAQWINEEDDIQCAIDSCPVDCIHWVNREELPALEYVCQKKMHRVNVATMMSQSSHSDDVFEATEMFLKDRRRLDEKKRKAEKTASPMQEAARQAAAEALAKERGGWLGQFGFRVAQQFASAAGGYSSSDDDRLEQNERVGQRKRAVRWDQSTPGGGATVPVERSLVPVFNKVDDL
eukprot:TRINITY_DN10988_c0_g1_i1.p1 TRINITY_DN10988_c0_g1~~TRINITY_DN10988_c0_g1_i1.p1  ORF type:complete len:359 (-),score=41.76 TRINITY_DN10988_c0_g1_i1:208-1284(-)